MFILMTNVFKKNFKDKKCSIENNKYGPSFIFIDNVGGVFKEYKINGMYHNSFGATVIMNFK